VLADCTCDCSRLAQAAQVGVQAALSSFESRWNISPLKAGEGRAAQAVKDPTVAVAVAKIMTEPSLAASMIPTSGQADLASLLAPALFAVVAGSDHAYRETDCLPTLRLCCSGTRQVVMAPIEAAWSTLSFPDGIPLGGGAPAEEMDISKLCHSFLHLSASSAATAFRKCTAFAGTLGKGDVLYTPPGWMVAERVLPGKGAQQDVCDPEVPSLFCFVLNSVAA
jgi:hypothetical protein